MDRRGQGERENFSLVSYDGNSRYRVGACLRSASGLRKASKQGGTAGF